MSAVVGIDPSLAATGICRTVTPDESEFGGWESWSILTKPGDVGRVNEIMRRTADALIFQTFAVIEDLPKHAHGAGLTGMAQGAVRIALFDNNVPYVTVPAATLKKYATGKGNATKADMRMALYQREGSDIRDDNQVDAFWLREIGLALLDSPAAIPMPKANRDALAKLELPEGVQP